MKEYVPSGRRVLFLYFAGLIILGTIALRLPFAWSGAIALSPVDALFTATSAVTVTGLSTVDTASYTVFGKVVLMLLMQAGGLGVVFVVVMGLQSRDAPVSVYNRKLAGDYFLASVESRPRRIVVKILVYAFAVEAAGFLALWLAFWLHQVPDSALAAAFHAVSAFCNAGFSTFSDNLESFAGRPEVTVTIAILIIVGGIGFVVLDDVRKRLFGDNRHLRSHTVMVLGMTMVLLGAGTAFFAVVEWNHALGRFGGDGAAKLYEAFFMSVTPRTAGFDSIPPASLHESSQLVTMLLMLIGGAPSSTAGGLKVTTAAILILMVLRGSEGQEDLAFGRRRIDRESVGKATVLFARAGILLFVLVLALVVAQNGFGQTRHSIFALAFETVSAFCTVGLSLGVTPTLDNAAKLIIILTMFLGRVGLTALALPRRRVGKRQVGHLPKGEVIIG
jgi:trk system potassium uptake protein TrkH